MQYLSTGAAKPSGWMPMAGSWEEVVLSWYEQGPPRLLYPSGARRPGVFAPDPRTQRTPTQADQQEP